MNNVAMTAECSPYGLLACRIVEQAIFDYRALMRSRTAGAKSGIDEIRHFLRSQWCDYLLSYTDVNGEWVLAQLEKEPVAPKKKFVRGGHVATIDGRTATINTWCRELGVSTTYAYRIYNQQGRECAEALLAAVVRERGL